MKKESIHFLTEDIDFQVVEPESVSSWIEDVARKHGYAIEQLDYIFCNDQFLLSLNKEHFQHDELTDILTFPLHAPGSKNIIGDIFISLDRVNENAISFDSGFIDELHRVMIHGLLHMSGFDDKTPALKKVMTQAEDVALSLRMF